LFKVAERLIAPNTTLSPAIISCFPPLARDRAGRGGGRISKIDLAVRATAAHAILARVYNDVSQISGALSVVDRSQTPDLLEALVRAHTLDRVAALRRCMLSTSQSAIVPLIAKEAASRLGKGTPDEIVTDRVRRHLQVFSLLAIVTEDYRRSLRQLPTSARRERSKAMTVLRGGCGLA